MVGTRADSLDSLMVAQTVEKTAALMGDTTVAVRVVSLAVVWAVMKAGVRAVQMAVPLAGQMVELWVACSAASLV